MKNKIMVFSGVALGGILITGFQNCSSKVSFSSKVPTTIQQSLVPLDDDDSNNQSAGVPSTNSGPSDPGTQPNNSGPSDPGTQANNGGPSNPGTSPNNNNEASNGGGPACNHGHGHNGRSDEMVGCLLLEEHGQKLKLGLLTSSLEGVRSRADSVCIPKSVCLGIVAQAFKVNTEVAPGSHGFCAHNPNVQHLNAEQVQALLPQP